MNSPNSPIRTDSITNGKWSTNQPRGSDQRSMSSQVELGCCRGPCLASDVWQEQVLEAYFSQDRLRHDRRDLDLLWLQFRFWQDLGLPVVSCCLLFLGPTKIQYRKKGTDLETVFGPVGATKACHGDGGSSPPRSDYFHDLLLF